MCVYICVYVSVCVECFSSLRHVQILNEGTLWCVRVRVCMYVAFVMYVCVYVVYVCAC